MITKDEVRQALPIHLKNAATDGLVDMLNTIPLDPDIAKQVRENFITYSGVLKDGRYKLEDYLNAIAYVTFRMMGYNNQESYARTFPQRYQGFTAQGKSAKDISAHVAMYNKGKLVTTILDQAMVPVWLTNMDVMQNAINKQVELMGNAKSEMVQHLAAKSLIELLKKPETKEINLNIGNVEDKGVEELRTMMIDLAQKQQSLIESGMTTNDIAKQKLINVTPKDEN